MQGNKGKKAANIKVVEKMDKQQVQRIEKTVRVIHECKEEGLWFGKVSFNSNR